MRDVGIEPPGVVARLMGLDSLPTSTVPDHDRSNRNLWSDFYAMEYINGAKEAGMDFLGIL
ncbi:hypothetical protein GBA52_018258 [Prunus armeniaca]|nr:hypothetical protein GBA52_018258 [Prunus armeniaca]